MRWRLSSRNADAKGRKGRNQSDGGADNQKLANEALADDAEGLGKNDSRASRRSKTTKRAERESAGRRPLRLSKRTSKVPTELNASSVTDSDPSSTEVAQDATQEPDSQAEPGVAAAPEPEPEPEPRLDPDDVLRTARISKKKQVNLDITFKFPEVKMTPWGQKWSIDAFALIHNAVKAELHDLYHIANVMQKRKWVLTQEHIEAFYSWWEEFEEFVTAVLDVEEDVFYPWLSSKELLRGDFKEATRMRAYGTFRNAIKNITEYRESFVPYLPVGERLDGLLEFISACNHIPGYYDAILGSLPHFIESCFRRREKDAVTKKVVAAIRGMDGYNRNLVLLVRWMNEGTQKRWAMGNLKTGDMLAFGSWRRLITKEHCLVAATFDDLVTEEKEETMGEPVIGAAMAVNEEMRDQLDRNRTSVRALPSSAFS